MKVWYSFGDLEEDPTLESYPCDVNLARQERPSSRGFRGGLSFVGSYDQHPQLLVCSPKPENLKCCYLSCEA